MKTARLAVAGMMLLTCAISHAQTLVERVYLMRTETTAFDQFSGMTHTCIVVFPDGHYRMERTFQGMSGGDPETKVYLDALPEPDLKGLQAALDDGKLEEIKTAPPRGGIVKDMDTLYISIPREHRLQNLNFNNAADRKPFEKALKPFLSSLKNLEKRKVPVAKSEKSNNCDVPRVMYRSNGVSMPNPDTDQRP